MLFYSLGGILAGSAASGPAAPVVAGILSAIQGGLLLRKLFGGNKAPAPTPTNPVTGQPVPIDPMTGQVWALDTQSGLPGDLTKQIWNMAVPEGFSTAGYDAGNYVTQGLPIWAANRFRGVADQLGGWDNLTKWLYDRNNWATALTLMSQPWGQSEVDKHAAGAGTEPNEGQTTPVEESQSGPVEPQTPEAQAQGNPTYSTTTIGANGVDPWLVGAAGAAGAGGLAALLSGGGTALQAPATGEQFELGPDGEWVLRTTATGQMPQDATPPQPEAPLPLPPASTSPNIPAGGNGSIWIRPPLTGQETIVPQEPMPGGSFPVGPIVAQPPATAPQAPTATPTEPNTPSVPRQQPQLGGGGGAVIPPAYPALSPQAPIAPIFNPQALFTATPGLNLSRLFGGF